jgi:hypothetical protein
MPLGINYMVTPPRLKLKAYTQDVRTRHPKWPGSISHLKQLISSASKEAQ